ncbi:hypothetical protein [Hymenobacter sp. CRA2]|uniref:hypothetical protein n=1 Tax=Hymenobacter sp. CRA2 TaxID=1955620 RepID=UPI00098EAE58|nr:hypothetical protein [Hymenobacter sp. CRA2]OON66450.1 hypothetical protein B0919_21685 [Hymenobacter sp. CRA2]
MSFSPELAEQIQFFVYYLCKGTVHRNLIDAEPPYVEQLLREREHLDHVFALFAEGLRRHLPQPDTLATEYLLARYRRYDPQREAELLALLPPAPPADVYSHFLHLARCFIHNTFLEPIQDPHYLLELAGNGSDAVRTFAVWTNVLARTVGAGQADYDQALRRANEFARDLFDGQLPAQPFTEAELEQEIY